MKKLVIVLATLLSGCAYNVTLMPRDSGKTFAGTIQAGAGHGTMSMAMGEVTCTGPIARVASDDTFGFATTYGVNSRGRASSSFSTIAAMGDVHAKAMLSCSDGSGLRCDISGRGNSAGGICADDKGRVFDAIATW